MSDFLTRLVERQAGRVATIQPRIPSMFVSALDGLDVPTPEPSPMSALHPTGEGTPEEGGRLPVRPAEVELLTARSMAPTASLSFRAASPDRDQPSVRPGLNVPTDQSSTMERLDAPLPHSSHRQPVRFQSSASEPAPISVALQSGRLHHADPALGENIELPPRLVESPIGVRGQLVAAPPSLVSTGFSGKGSERNTLGEAEPPTVQVSIGRIEVTAVTSPPLPKRKSASRQPSMSLQDYLSRRQGRGT
jgi:hypothetical protein